MKFFATAAIVVASLIALASPSVAVEPFWEGKYSKPIQVEGGYAVNDPKKGWFKFGVCENRNGSQGRGWYCHTQLGELPGKPDQAETQSADVNVTATVQVAASSGLVNAGETLYAIFKPTAMSELGLSDNLINLTDNNKGAGHMAKMRALCERVQGSKCEFASAPDHDVMGAARKVHDLHPRWHLF